MSHWDDLDGVEDQDASDRQYQDALARDCPYCYVSAGEECDFNAMHMSRVYASGEMLSWPYRHLAQPS